MCPFRRSDELNAFSHMWHLYGFSPLWMLTRRTWLNVFCTFGTDKCTSVNFSSILISLFFPYSFFSDSLQCDHKVLRIGALYSLNRGHLYLFDLSCKIMQFGACLVRNLAAAEIQNTTVTTEISMGLSEYCKFYSFCTYVNQRRRNAKFQLLTGITFRIPLSLMGGSSGCCWRSPFWHFWMFVS